MEKLPQGRFKFGGQCLIEREAHMLHAMLCYEDVLT